MKTALITSVSGQDSLLLSRYLIEEQNYNIYVMGRRVARALPRAVVELQSNFPDKYHILHGDITDITAIINAINIAEPDEFYNLAAQSHVGISFTESLSTLQITGFGAVNCIEAVRKTNPNIRFYQAGSSEEFGGVQSVDKGWLDAGQLKNGIPYIVLNEDAPLKPKSPYACAKVLAHNWIANVREAYGLFACIGQLFNHESVLRKPEFVTRKITIAATEIALGIRNELRLGTLNFARDFGWAVDYVKAMHMMLQQQIPTDFVIATGKAYTGEELLTTAFGHYNLDWHKYVKIDNEFSRPSDVRVLIGDSTKAETILGFKHSKTFEQLIKLMCEHDMQTYQNFGEIVE